MVKLVVAVVVVGCGCLGCQVLDLWCGVWEGKMPVGPVMVFGRNLIHPFREWSDCAKEREGSLLLSFKHSVKCCCFS